jgi:integrase
VVKPTPASPMTAFEAAQSWLNALYHETITLPEVRSGRPREYLTEREIEKLMDAARGNRWGHRDATAILLAYRHGLRASELVALRWDDVDFTTGKLHVRRAKGGMTSVHPLGGKELRALRKLQRETPEGARTVHVFVSERLAPLSVAGYQRMVARAGEAAGLAQRLAGRVKADLCRVEGPLCGAARGPGHFGGLPTREGMAQAVHSGLVA